MRREGNEDKAEGGMGRAFLQFTQEILRSHFLKRVFPGGGRKPNPGIENPQIDTLGI